LLTATAFSSPRSSTTPHSTEGARLAGAPRLTAVGRHCPHARACGGWQLRCFRTPLWMLSRRACCRKRWCRVGRGT
jgi:hypothetical protein